MMLHLDEIMLGVMLLAGGLFCIAAVALEPLGDTAIAAVEDRAGAVRQLKTYGYGQSLLVRYRIADGVRCAGISFLQRWRE